MKNNITKYLQEAAYAANDAVKATLRMYSDECLTDEDDITGVLIGQLDSTFKNKIGGITWSSSILRHRKGVAAQEKKVGADMLFSRLNYNSRTHLLKGGPDSVKENWQKY